MTPDEVIKTVAGYFGMASVTLKKKSSRGNIVYARKFAILLISSRLKKSDEEIANAIGCIKRSAVTIARNKLTGAIQAAISPMLPDYIALDKLIPQEAEKPLVDTSTLAKGIKWLDKENKGLKEENERLAAELNLEKKITRMARERFVLNMHDQYTIPQMSEIWAAPYDTIRVILENNGLKPNRVYGARQ